MPTCQTTSTIARCDDRLVRELPDPGLLVHGFTQGDCAGIASYCAARIDQLHPLTTGVSVGRVGAGLARHLRWVTLPNGGISPNGGSTT